MTSNNAGHERKWEIIAAFAFGCVFLIVILFAAFFRPTPTAFEYTVFRITISLAAAGIGAILPGFLIVKYKNLIRAGGALGLFVVVYFFPPVPVVEPLPPPTPPSEATTDAKARIDDWLSLIDKARYEDAYNAMAQGFKSRYPYAQFEELISRERSSLGTNPARVLVSTSPFISPPGAPVGSYKQYVYKTVFDQVPAPVYEVTWVVTEKEDWYVTGFSIMVKTDAGIFVPYEPN